MKIIGVTFENDERIDYYRYYEPIKIGYNVVVENDSGKYFATVATEIHEIDEDKLEMTLGRILRVSTKDDYKKYNDNKKKEISVIKKSNELIKKYKLDMKVLDAKFTLNKDQLLIRFYSDGRVDFRNLAKDLAAIYKTRIELRQIGVRDKAKIVGGVGVCGQKLCCSRFLKNFDSVSIAMAKNQDLALNPNKINGVCGRLMCCLKYEQNVYEEKLKRLPKIGAIVQTEEGTGEVCGIETLKEIIKVKLNDGDETYYKKFNAKDIKIIKDAEDEDKLDVESQEDLKELEKLEKLEQIDSKNSNDDI